MPQVGEMVFYYQGDSEAPSGFDKVLWRGNGGTRFHPAVVTNVGEANRLNLVVFFDRTGAIVRSDVEALPDSSFVSGVHCSDCGWRLTSDISAAPHEAPAAEPPSASEPQA